MTDPRLAEAFRLIGLVVAEAYERGRKDEIARIQGLLQAGISERVSVSDTSDAVVIRPARPPADQSGGQRSPRGSVRRLIERSLAERGAFGASPADIAADRQGNDEMTIQSASIRTELRRGQEKGRYAESNGRWFLVHGAEKTSPEGASLLGLPSGDDVFK